MSGLYIHIPFCRKACHYCDFHFSTILRNRAEMVACLIREIELRKSDDDKESMSLETIYFGGGTPSILSTDELKMIFEAIRTHYILAEDIEITLEANPEDINPSSLDQWLEIGINRLSVGIQTFRDEALKFVNRAHSSGDAISSLSMIRQGGFTNITADLIFGIPPFKITQWQDDLSKLISFDLQHLSVYGLTIEPRTAFGRWHEKGKLSTASDETMEEAFRVAHELLTTQSYEHYEVSNYAKPGYESKHNTSYWQGKNYIGIGPGAHSYDGIHRSYNVSNNAKYMKEIQKGNLPLTIEKLSPIDQINEYIYTRLRTSKGLSLAEFGNLFSQNFYTVHQGLIDEFISRNLMERNHDTLILTLDGMLLADEISLKLFYE